MDSGRCSPQARSGGSRRAWQSGKALVDNSDGEATEGIRQAVEAGRKFMSVESRSLSERTTRGGVREVLRALVDAIALTASPEYDTTAAEVRSKQRRRVWL